MSIFSQKKQTASALSVLAIATGLFVATPAITLANGLPGLTIFGGPGRGNALPFRLDFGGVPDQWDRYRLRIPARKLNLAAAQFTISYDQSPARFDGKFDTEEIEVRVKGESVPLQEVIWDQENNLIEIYPEEPVPAGSQVELVLSNVKNPDFGIYYFKCLILTPGDVPLPRYIGTWDLTISR